MKACLLIRNDWLLFVAWPAHFVSWGVCLMSTDTRVRGYFDVNESSYIIELLASNFFRLIV